MLGYFINVAMNQSISSYLLLLLAGGLTAKAQDAAIIYLFETFYIFFNLKRSISFSILKLHFI